MKKKNEIELTCKQNEIMYKLYEDKGIASIIKSPDANGDIIIPRSIEYQSKNYIVKEISEEAFSYNKTIKSISFAPDSELAKINKFSFTNSSIQSISIPDSVEELKDGFANGAYLLTDIKISSNHKKLSYVQNCYLLYEDTLIFVRRDIEKAVIPCNVKRIGERSFDTCCDLFSVSFSSKKKKKPSITEISDFSFYHCSNLLSIELPSTLEKIGNFCFYNCNKLTNLTFQDCQLSEVGRCIFFNSPVATFTIPPSLTNINEGFMLGVIGQIDLTLSPENKHYTIYKNDYIIKKDIILYARRDIETAVIPSFITKIGEGAFDHCYKLKSLTFERNNDNLINLKQIGSYAFSNCDCIMKFEFPATLEYIGDNAFRNCSNLISVTPISNELNEFKLEGIGIDCFYQCKSLKMVVFPSSLKHVSKRCFCDCENLAQVDFLEDEKSKSLLESIDDFAFSNCFQLSKIKFPSNIKNIGRYAFNNCESLTVLKIDDDSLLESIGSCAFSSTKIESLKIPSKVNFLDEGCFHGTLNSINIDMSPDNKFINLLDNSMFICNDLVVYSKNGIVDAFIPKNVKKICSFAFYSNPSLKSISFTDPDDSSLDEISDSAFAYCINLNRMLPIPVSVSVMGKFAFLAVKSLPCLEFLANEVFIDDYCFEKCLSLSLVSFPNAVVIGIGFMSFLNVDDEFALFTIPETTFKYNNTKKKI